MRILSEEVAGGDMAVLDKMFEKGEIETSKYLPIVLARMKEESDKLMESYYKSLPYATAEASRQREKWMREFAEGGAEKGILRFWEVWGAFVKESRSWAPQLGEIFGRVSWEFSRFFLMYNEFKRWAFRGETDPRNYFQKTFGDYEGSFFEASVEQMERAKKTMGELFSLIGQAFGEAGIMKKTVEIMSAVIYEVSSILNILALVAQGKFREAKKEFSIYSKDDALRLEAIKMGLPFGSDEYKNYILEGRKKAREDANKESQALEVIERSKPSPRSLAELHMSPEDLAMKDTNLFARLWKTPEYLEALKFYQSRKAESEEYNKQLRLLREVGAEAFLSGVGFQESITTDRIDFRDNNWETLSREEQQKQLMQNVYSTTNQNISVQLRVDGIATMDGIEAGLKSAVERIFPSGLYQYNTTIPNVVQ